MRKRIAFSPSGRAIYDREVGGCAVLSEEPKNTVHKRVPYFFMLRGQDLNLKEARGTRKRSAFAPSGRAICDREVGGCAAGAYAVLSEEPIPCNKAGDFFFG